jgi:TolA-binding protein
MIVDFFPASRHKEISGRIFITSEGENGIIINTTNTVKSQLNRRVSLALSLNPEGLALKDINNAVAGQPLNLTVANIENNYKDGLKYFYAKNFAEAENIFHQIAKNYPRHALADNAKWWEAEISYVKKDYNQALKIYSHVFGLGDGNKEAYAQYRIGCCYKELNMPDRALQELRNVRKLYPDHREEWGKAQQIIKTITN